MKFKVNGHDVDIDAPADEPLLWVIRELVGLTGTKFGCGIGACGACTVHVDGESVRSCTYPAALLEGKHVTTIEGCRQTGRTRCKSRGSSIRFLNAATANPG